MIDESRTPSLAGSLTNYRGLLNFGVHVIVFLRALTSYGFRTARADLVQSSNISHYEIDSANRLDISYFTANTQDKWPSSEIMSSTVYHATEGYESPLSPRITSPFNTRRLIHRFQCQNYFEVSHLSKNAIRRRFDWS